MTGSVSLPAEIIDIIASFHDYKPVYDTVMKQLVCEFHLFEQKKLLQKKRFEYHNWLYDIYPYSLEVVQ